MNMDSNFLEDVIKPEQRKKFEAEKKQWLGGGLVVQQDARDVQAGVRGNADDSALLEVLLH